MGLARDRTPQDDGPSDLATALVELILQTAIELWNGPDERPYASIRRGQGVVHLPIEGSAFRSYCSRIFYKTRRKALSNETRQAAINTVAAHAIHEGKCYTVETRVGWTEDAVYIALHNDEGNVVEALADGWRVIEGDKSPIRFVKPRDCRPLPVPTKGGSIEDLRPLLNVEDRDWALVKAFIVGTFLPNGTFPVLVGNGEQGSGKSFGCRLLRELVDPVKSPHRGVPKNSENLLSALASSYLMAFDNLSGLTAEQSDWICRISSGAGIATRTFYTNLEETVVEARRPVILNGIGEVVSRPDLADRSLLVSFRRLSNERRGEDEMLNEYELNKPGILGDVLDRVCRAIAGWKSIQSSGIRLHDFGKWALAAAPEGQEREALRSVLSENRLELQGSVIEHDQFAQAIMELLNDDGGLTVTASELLHRLDQRRGDRRQPPDWPKTAKAAANHLTRIAPNLRTPGFQIEHLPRTSHSRPWRLAPPCELDEQSSQSSPPSSAVACGVREPILTGDGGSSVIDGASSIPSPGSSESLNWDGVLNDNGDGRDGSEPRFPSKDVEFIEGEI